MRRADCLAVALLAAWAAPVAGQRPASRPPISPFGEQAELLPSAATADSYFGYHVSVSGDTVVVGANQDDPPAGANAGSAYVFVRSGTIWTEQQRLTASDGAPNDTFGIEVSIFGDTAVVGAPLSDTPAGTNAGSAYVFVRSGTTWTEQQKLTAPDGAAEDWFGRSVSVHGDTVVVGAWFDDTAAGNGAGSAYVFVRSGTTWTLQQKLVALDGAAGDGLGGRVSISGDTVVVGAVHDDDDGPAGSDSGSAYVFVRAGTTWTEQQKLTASDGARNDWFGYMLSASGDTIAVGARSGPGAAYVFARAGAAWTQQQKLTVSSGTAVSVSGDVIVVGAPGDGTLAAPNVGAAYVFARAGTAWIQQQKLTASDGAVGDSLGWSVSLSQDTIVLGALGGDGPSVANTGSAYVFRLVPASYYVLTPCRVVDTRTTGGFALAANSTRIFAIAGRCQVPADAQAVAAILVAVNPGDPGDLRLYPDGQPTPVASTLNFAAGVTRANNAIVSLGGGQILVRCDMPTGSTVSTHFVVDVFGYFR